MGRVLFFALLAAMAAGLPALEKIPESPKNSDLLALMEKAAVLHFNGLYGESNEAVEKAYALSERLYTTSVSKNFFSLFTDDRALDYEGEDYERMALHDLAMINYAMLGRPDDAVVEARRIDEFLATLRQKRSEEEVSHLGGLSRYLCGLMYEEAGNWNDALIDYEHAAGAYAVYKEAFGLEAPACLGRDLKRLRAKMDGGPAIPRFPAKGYGEALVLVYENQLPPKRVFRLELKVGAPVPRPHLRIKSARVKSGGGRSAEAELLENVVEKTRYYTQKRLNAGLGRKMARGFLKGMLNPIVWYYSFGRVTLPKTKVDDRLWASLPAGVRFARLPLPAGRHKLSLDYETIYGKHFEINGEVEVKAGKGSMAVFRAYGIRP